MDELQKLFELLSQARKLSAELRIQYADTREWFVLDRINQDISNTILEVNLLATKVKKDISNGKSNNNL